MAGMFVTLVLFQYLPQMESFKAYGIEAKMRAKLSEAEEILNKLRAAAKVSGRLTYHTLAWSSRLANPVKEKQALADEVDDLLRGLGIDGQELAKIKEDYLNLIVLDLWLLFREIMEINVRSTVSEVKNARLTQSTKNNNELETETLDKREQALNEFSKQARNFDPQKNLKDNCIAMMPPQGLLSDIDMEALQAFETRLEDLASECLNEGRLTDNAADSIKQHHSPGARKVYADIFGKHPAA